MNDLIEAIRAAVADGATTDQKAIGAQACRTILAALDAQPGKPIVLPGAPPANPPLRLTLDQVLDLAIARLTPIANAQAAETAPSAPATAPRGLRVPVVTPPPQVAHVLRRKR